MDDSMRRHHERNGTAHQFGTDNAADLPVGHPAIQLFIEIGVHNANAAAKDAAFTQKFGSSKAATVVKTGVATAVLTWIARNADAADAMRDLHVGIEKQFPPPRKLSKVALLARGRADYAATAANEADFVMYGNFPADFRTQLNTACDDLEAAISNQDTQSDERVIARAEVEAEVEASNRKVRLAHPLMKNLYHGNRAKYAGWVSASHVEAAPKTSVTPTPVPPIGGNPIPEPPTP